MSHNKIPDFTETELWAVRSTLKERYGKEVEPQMADTEVMLGGADGMAWCPALFWSAKGANLNLNEPSPQPCRNSKRTQLSTLPLRTFTVLCVLGALCS